MPGGGYEAGRVYVVLGYDLDDRELRKYDEQVARLRREKDVETRLAYDVDDRAAREYKRELDALRARKDVKTGLGFDYDNRGYRQFVADVAKASTLRGHKYEVKVDYDQSGASRARRGLSDLEGAGRGLEGGLLGVASAASNARIGFGFLGTSVGGLLTVAVTLGPVLLAVAGALSALVGSLGAAVAGLAALGTGLVGTFLPVAVLAIGAFERLSAIMKVYTAQGQAAAASQRNTAAAGRSRASSADSEAAALDGLKNANVALRESRISLTRAETDYGRAVDEAQKRIRDARDAEVAAARDVQQAQENLTQARLDAQRALEDSQRRAEDTAITQADAARRVSELQAAGDTSGRDYFDAQRALSGATTEAGRAAQDNAAYAKQGVMAYQPLVEALRRLADVTRTYHQRQVELRTVEAEGVRRAPNVIAALDRIRLAREAVTRSIQSQHAAERSLASSRRGAAGAAAGISSQDQRAQQLLGGLSPVEVGLLGMIKRVIKSFRDATKEGVDALLAGISSGLGRLPAALEELKPDLTKLGGELGKVTDHFFADLTGPRWISAWHKFAAAAGPVMDDLERITTDWMSIFRDIAEAVLPDLKKSLGDTATNMDDLADKIHKSLGDDGPHGLGAKVHSLVGSFRDWWGLLKSLGGLLVAFFGAGKKTGDSMTESLTKTFDKWHAWINDNPKEIRKFFDDARHFVDNVLKVAGPFIKGWIALASALLGLAAGLPTSWLVAFGAAWLAMAGLAKFAGAIKVLELMRGLVGRRLPTMPGAGSGGPGATGPGAAGPVRPGTTEGGPTGGPRDVRARAGRGRFGPEFRYGAPTSEVGQVRGSPGSRFGGAGGAATIAALALPYIVPADSRLGRILFGPSQSGDPRKDTLARESVGYGIHSATGLPHSSDLKVINEQIDTLIRGGDESKLRKLQKQLDDTFNANKNTDVFNPRLIKVYADAVGKAADAVAARLKAQEEAQRHVGAVAREVSADTSARWRRLADNVKASANDMETAVSRNAAEIKRRLGADSEAGARALNSNFEDAVGWVRANMTQAGKLTRDGMAEIERLLRAHLADFGITGRQADRYIKGEDTLTGKPLSAPGKAMGGWIGHPGERGQDDVSVALPEGSAVYNAYQQPIIAMARRLLGRAFAAGGLVRAVVGRGEYAALPGEARSDDATLRAAFGFGLTDLFDRTARTRHSEGMRAQAGGQAARRETLRELNRRFPAHSLSNAAGHYRMSPDQVVTVAESEGLPGRAFEQIAHGESEYYPGIVEADEGGGVRGYGLFQNTTVVNGTPFEQVVQRLGGWLEQLNPIKAARAARWLYDRGGLGHWHGTRFLGKVSSAVYAGGSQATTAVAKAIKKLKVPAIAGKTALDAIVSGTMRAGIRGANAVLGRVPDQTTVIGGPAAGTSVGPAGGPDGLGTFDGFPVAQWIIPELTYARAHGWSGHITSGYRSHATNVAHGRNFTSEHEGTQYPHGAVDFGGGYGYWDPVAKANRDAFFAATQGYGGRRLIPATGFEDWGHASGTGRTAGGFLGGLPFAGTFAGGGFTWGGGRRTAFGPTYGGRLRRGGASPGRGGAVSGGSGPSYIGIAGAQVAAGSVTSPALAGFLGDVRFGDTSYKALEVGLESDAATRSGSTYRGFIDDISKTDRTISYKQRLFGDIDVPLVDEDTGKVNERGVAIRVAALQEIRDLQQHIVDVYNQIVDYINRVIAAYQEAIKRLQWVVNAGFAPNDPNAAAGIFSQIGSYSSILDSWRGKLDDIAGTGGLLDLAKLTVGETEQQIKGVRGTKPSGAATAAPSASAVAAAALQQFQNFQTGQADLFRNFGGNAVGARVLSAAGLGYGGGASLAAGLKDYGAVPSSLAPGAALGAGASSPSMVVPAPIGSGAESPQVTQHINITVADANEAHTFTKAALFEMQAAVS